MDHGTRDESSSENSRDEVVSDTVIVIRSAETACVVGVGGGGEDRDSKGEGNVLGTSKVSVVEEQRKINVCENEKHLSCVIDVKCSGGDCDGGFGDNWDGEKVCRICHLSSDQPSETTNTITTTTTTTTATTTTDLIQLGCGCKDELGIAHTQCAEAWFKLRGNRLCEICGETAKNITGVGDYRFMDEWNETRFTGSITSSSDRGGGCWRGQPFCNFLMACLGSNFISCHLDNQASDCAVHLLHGCDSVASMVFRFRIVIGTNFILEAGKRLIRPQYWESFISFFCLLVFFLFLFFLSLGLLRISHASVI